MQSEPTIISNTITHTISEPSVHSSQHGLPSSDNPAFAASSHSGQSQSAINAHALVTLQSVAGAEGGLVDELPRLKGVAGGDLPHHFSKEIVDNDIDLGPESPKNRPSGPGFKVTKSKAGTPGGIHLDQFPNGKGAHIGLGLELIVNRGSDSHFVPSTCNFFINGIASVQKVLQLGHYPSCLAYRFFTLLSRAGCCKRKLLHAQQPPQL